MMLIKVKLMNKANFEYLRLFYYFLLLIYLLLKYNYIFDLYFTIVHLYFWNVQNLISVK